MPAAAPVKDRRPPVSVPVPAQPAAPASIEGSVRLKGVKTGADWKSMSRPDKEICVLSLMGNLSRSDVFLEKPYNFYITQLDKQLQGNPSLENEYLHRLLLKSAYENEPESRKDIEKVWN